MATRGGNRAAAKPPKREPAQVADSKLVAERGELEVTALVAMAAPYNPRKIDADEMAALRRSIHFFGFVEPLVVNRRFDRIVGGHQRLQAAREEGYTRLPVMFVDLDEPSEKQLNLALNRISGEWDDDKLRALLADLSAAGADLKLTGFGDEELAELLRKAATSGNTDADDAPPLAEKALTVAGDLWELGAHRLICGDARQPQTLALLMAGHQVDLVLTDPPYNVAYEGTASKKRRGIANDSMSPQQFYSFLHEAFAAVRTVAKDGAGIYVFHAHMESSNFHLAIGNAGWRLAQCCVWVKHALQFGRQDYHWQHEPVLYGWNPSGSHRWYADRKQTTVWNFDKPSRSDLHPTMKPVAMLEYILGNSSRGGDVVLDAFGGSGSTLIACEKLSRMARLVELDPLYCDVIVRRWQDFSGKVAVHAGTGETFAERQRAVAPDAELHGVAAQMNG